MTTHSQTPNFGVNYDVGWIGFQFVDNNLISLGIAWFTKWTAYKNIPVSHTFICTGHDECVEALGSGVVRSGLSERFADKHTHVCFRKPRHWDKASADQIKRTAEAHIGDKYDYSLILADALAGSMVGKLVNLLTRNWANRIVTKLLDSKKQQICSELAATALRSVPVLSHLGCLTLPPRMIVPSQLFSDEQVFEPWKDR